MKKEIDLKNAYTTICDMFNRDASNYTVDPKTNVKIYGWVVFDDNFEMVDLKKYSVESCVNMYNVATKHMQNFN